MANNACTHALSFQFSASLTPDILVYKEECTRCFDNQDMPTGIDVCLSCFNGGCTRPDKHHAEAHAAKTGHPLTLNIRRVPRRPDNDETAMRDDSEMIRPTKLTKLEITEKSEEELFAFETTVRCWECHLHSVDRSIPAISNAVAFIMNSASARKTKAARAWKWSEGLVECPHASELAQKPYPGFSLNAREKCISCDKTENLWMCLTCGNVGCGRRQYDGSGGNNHAIEHYEKTGHFLCVKLGTITPSGTGDVMCYRCDDMCKLPQLESCLGVFGIDMSKLSKTDKSMAELQLEYNEKFDFSMTTDDGRKLERVYGPGQAGLKNLGNSCYLASVVQCLFHLRAFKHRYFDGLAILRPLEDSGLPTENLLCQLEKLADGIWSGRYSLPDHESGGDNGNDVKYKLSPDMFKDVIAKGHPEFESMQQQDAYEFFQYLVKQVSQKEFSAEGGKHDPTKMFEFEVEERLECCQCKRTRYSTHLATSFSINVPKRPAGEIDGVMQYDNVDIKECFDFATAPSAIEGYRCPFCQTTTTASKTTKFKTFPSVLVVQAQRFELENWTPKKLEIPLVVPLTGLDLEGYRGCGQQPGEELLPEDNLQSTTTTAGQPEVSQDTLNELLAMGFPEVRCRKAIIRTNNSGAEIALNWLLEHMDDPDIDVPEEGAPGGPAGRMAASISSEHIQSLCDMGFTEQQARKALSETDNDVARAVEWLFSHPEDPCDNAPSVNSDAQQQQQQGQAEALSIKDDGVPGVYTLASFISHKGTSTHCGHYVAHIRNPKRNSLVGESEDKWVLFNDERVAIQPNPPTAQAYVYIFVKDEALLV